MKAFTFTLSSLLVGASLVSAAAMPEPTSAPEMDKRQLPGLDISAILANPSSALGQISSLLQNPTIASIFASVTADPAFQSSISAEIVSAVGTESASAALAQYSSALAGFASVTATGGSTMSGSSSTMSMATNTAATSPTTSASTGSGSNGASFANGPSSFVVTLVGTAATLGAAIVLLA